MIESEEMCVRVAASLVKAASGASMPLIFKASYDKANRTSLRSFRGPGLTAGLKVLARVRQEFGCPVLSDVHECGQVAAAAEVLDAIQIPAFLCRQTDLVVVAAKTGKAVNIKKGQFMAPQDMRFILDKAYSTGNRSVFLTERGTTFGYGNLVVDMRSLVIMRRFGCPVVFDGTHSVQLPGAAGGKTGGQREFVEPLLRAAVATGCDGLFLEVHPDPDKALSDGPNMLPLDVLPRLLPKLQALHDLAAGRS